jgi:outer membrane receptor for ferrienterochelin and colicin
MRRTLSGLLAIAGATLAVLLLVAAPLHAQGAGKITGVVTDASTGAPLAGVQVYLEGTGRGALTQENGRYFIINVQPRTYVMVVEIIGYATERRDNVVVQIDQTVQQDFALPPEAVALGEIVVSTSRTPLVPEGQTGSVDMVSKTQIEALPVTDIVGVLELTQGFLAVPTDNTTVVTYAQSRQGVTALRIRGGRGAETTFLIDGIPINNFVLGGPALDITNKAIEQVAVFRGQMDAQYGNALSGVIAYSTPEGTSELAGNIELRSSVAGDWLGNEHDATRDFDMFEGYLSGPIPGTQEKLRFFVAGRQRYGADRAYEFDDQVFDPSTPSTAFNEPDEMDVRAGWQAHGYDEVRDVYAKLNYYVNPSSKISASFIGYERERQPFDFDWQFAGVNPLDAMTTAQDSAYYLSRQTLLQRQYLVQSSLRLDRQMFILGWDQTLGRSQYNITFGYFDQQRTTCNYISGVCLEDRFEDPNFNGGWVAPGPAVFLNTPTAGTDSFWGGEKNTTLTGRFDFVSQVSDHHELSGGLFYQNHDLVYDEWQDVGVNDVVKLWSYFEASPWDAAFYIQDKIEYDFLTLKLGARFDYGKATGFFLANPVDPTNGTNALDVCRNPQDWQNVQVKRWIPDPNDPSNRNAGTSEVVNLSADPSWTLANCTLDVRAEAAEIASSDDFSESDARTQFSPRIGVAFPVTESSSLYFNFGRYSQNPLLINNYRATGIGTPREGTVDGPDIFVNASAGETPFLGNPQLLTETSTAYEIGYTQEIAGTWALQAQVFSKDQTGLTGTARVGQPPFTVVDPGVTYGFSAPNYVILTNQDFMTTRGIELQLRKRLQDYWATQLSYGYSSCRTNAADPEREFESTTQEDDPTLRDEIRCEIDQPHKFTGVLTFAMRNETPDGWGWARNSNLSFVFKAASGLPYTPTNSFTGFAAENQFERYSGRAPTTWQLDMQLRKDFTFGNARYGIFVDIFNVTDKLNCIQVFETSGNCTSGAEDQDRRRAGNSVGANTDSTFFDRPQFFGQRRTITAGLRVVF